MRSLHLFFLGLSTPLIGLRWMKETSVRRLYVFPFILTIALTLTYLWTALRYLPLLASWLYERTSVWVGSEAEWLSWVATIASWLIGIVLIGIVSHATAQVVLAPFCSWMAEFILKACGREPKSAFFRMLQASVLNGLLLLILGFLFFLLAFIPGANLMAHFGFLLALAYSCFDFPLEALGLNFRERLRFARDHLPAYAGLACVFAFILLIPGLNFLLFPLLVAGGSDLVVRLTENPTRSG